MKTFILLIVCLSVVFCHKPKKPKCTPAPEPVCTTQPPPLWNSCEHAENSDMCGMDNYLRLAIKARSNPILDPYNVGRGCFHLGCEKFTLSDIWFTVYKNNGTPTDILSTYDPETKEILLRSNFTRPRVTGTMNYEFYDGAEGKLTIEAGPVVYEPVIRGTVNCDGKIDLHDLEFFVRADEFTAHTEPSKHCQQKNFSQDAIAAIVEAYSHSYADTVQDLITSIFADTSIEDFQNFFPPPPPEPTCQHPTTPIPSSSCEDY